MNKSYLLILGLGAMVATVRAASAGPLTDVPAGHWAKPAVQSMVQKKILSARPDGRFHGSQPVTRYELAVALDRMVAFIEAGRKPLHAAPPQATLPAPAGASQAVRTAMIHLARGGFLPKTSPILNGTGTESVTARQLSDALAQVTIRLSDRSLPPNKE